jgi:sugar phosphate isomerase/epimerase
MSARQLGIFARVFPAGPAAQVAGDIAAAGYALAQLNLSALGRPTLPSAQEWADIDGAAIQRDFARAGVGLWGLSASYNMAHPDAEIRRAGTEAAIRAIAAAPAFGVTAVTLCTGSRNPERMWSAHPDNASPGAWSDLRTELDALLTAATEAGVLLGVEPEPGNVVSGADAAARLLRELGPDADRIAIIADSANLLHGVAPERHAAVLEHAFSTLGPAIGALHAKDLVPWADALDGRGVVDYGFVARLWRELPQRPPVIVQDVAAADAARLQRRLAGLFGPTTG